MLIKTILNKIEKFKSFIYGKITLEWISGAEALIVEVKPRRNTKSAGNGSRHMIRSLCVYLNTSRCGESRYTSGMLLAGRTVEWMEHWWRLCPGLRGKSI